MYLVKIGTFAALPAGTSPKPALWAARFFPFALFLTGCLGSWSKNI